MQVNPQEKIQIAFLVGDTTDMNTYFAQSVLRDTMTNAILGTVQLTQDPENTRRFFGYISAPSNNTPTGRYVNLTTSLYTDDTYETLVAAYPEVMSQYIVSQRWDAAQGGGGSGDPFYSNTLSVVRDEMRKLLPVYPRLAAIETALEAALALAPAASEGGDDEGVGAKQTGLKKAITRAVRDAMKKQEPDPALAELKNALESIHTLVAGAESSNEDTRSTLKDALGRIMTAADTVVASYLYHSVKDLPPVQAPEEQEDGGDVPLGDALAEGGQPTKHRMPSKGVVPVHVIARNRRAMKQGVLQP